MPTPPPLRQEREHQKRAFELYHAAGTKRSYAQVAQQMDVALSTVKVWAQSFGWSQRLREREAAAARKLADQALRPGQDEGDRNLRIVRAALVRLAKGIAEGKVRMQMGDLDRLIRLEEHLGQNARSQDPDWMRGATPDQLRAQRRALILRLMQLHPEVVAEYLQRAGGASQAASPPSTPGPDVVAPASSDAPNPPDLPDQKSRPD